MAQIVPGVPGWGTLIGRGVGQGVAGHLENIIQEKARKIAEKHEYERNLQFLKGIPGLQNAEQLAHGSPEQINQFLKSSLGGQSSSCLNP